MSQFHNNVVVLPYTYVHPPRTTIVSNPTYNLNQKMVKDMLYKPEDSQPATSSTNTITSNLPLILAGVAVAGVVMLVISKPASSGVTAFKTVS